jgi:ribosome-associated toxin RatA of RatAB toxin-antitoxin module
MPSYGECRTAEVGAPPQACFDALTDFEHLPDWQGALRDVRVLEERPDGADVEYEVDARVKRVRYRLRLSYDEPRVIRSEYLGGDFRDFCGEWRFIALDGDRTRVELDLRIDPGRFVPGPLRGMIADAVMRRALTDLQHHFNGV